MLMPDIVPDIDNWLLITEWKIEKKTCIFPKIIILWAFFCSRSSVGLERLPAKEEVTGSSPVDCTITK